MDGWIDGRLERRSGGRDEEGLFSRDRNRQTLTHRDFSPEALLALESADFGPSSTGTHSLTHTPTDGQKPTHALTPSNAELSRAR